MKLRFFAALLALMLLATACSKVDDRITPPGPTATIAPPSTPTLHQTSEAVSQATSPVPAASTPTPTESPTFTPTSTPTASPTWTLTPTATASPTPSPTPAPQGYLTQDVLVYAGPDDAFPVVGSIAGGQSITLLATDATGAWLQVDIGEGGQSWIPAQVVQAPPETALPLAKAIPTPPPPARPDDIVQLIERQITIPTYPWRQFLTPAFDETTQSHFQRFDRQAYEQSHPAPTPQNYTLIQLENRWLSVSVLPELGGRIYQLIFKPTGHNELYQNGVIKPSPWGPENAGTGWLAAGGIEWGLPVPEHGYLWGEPWGHITLPGPDAQSITLFDQNQDSVHLSVTLTLVPDTAAMALHFELENQGDRSIPVSFWLNAMLAPGARNSVGPELRFFFPMQQARVHSTGDPTLPPPGGLFDWPIYQGRDLSRLGAWGPWLGFFAAPQAQNRWAAVYDVAEKEGVVRIFSPDDLPGLKGFGFGWAQPISPDHYTDDGSAYVELQGGLTPTYDERFPLQPGDLYTWDEVWYPIAGLNGVSYADEQGALHLQTTNDGLRLQLFATRPRSGQLTIIDARAQVYTQTISLSPDAPAEVVLPGALAPIDMQFTANDAIWKVQSLAP